MAPWLDCIFSLQSPVCSRSTEESISDSSYTDTVYSLYIPSQSFIGQLDPLIRFKKHRGEAVFVASSPLACIRGFEH